MFWFVSFKFLIYCAAKVRFVIFDARFVILIFLKHTMWGEFFLCYDLPFCSMKHTLHFKVKIIFVCYTVLGKSVGGSNLDLTWIWFISAIPPWIRSRCLQTSAGSCPRQTMFQSIMALPCHQALLSVRAGWWNFIILFAWMLQIHKFAMRDQTNVILKCEYPTRPQFWEPLQHSMYIWSEKPTMQSYQIPGSSWNSGHNVGFHCPGRIAILHVRLISFVTDNLSFDTIYLVWSICRDCPVLFWFWWKHVTSLVHADSFAGAHVFPEPFANGCSYADGLHSSVQTV